MLKGPGLEDLSNTLTAMIFKALKDRNFTYDAVEGIKRDLLYHISTMCPGPIDLEDKKIVHVEEKKQRSLEHKTLNVEIINRIIESNQPNSVVQNRRRVSSQVSLIYNIMPSQLDSYKIRKIHELIQEYDSFSEDDELRFTYLQKFNDYSNRFDLYKDNVFLEFLKGQIKNSNNKHIIFESLFILHKLILTSKLEHEDYFIEYINKEYFPFLKGNLISGAEMYEYSFSKIEQIIEEIRNVLSDEEICEIYWNRMKNMIPSIRGADVTTNRLWNCINAVNNYKCKIKTEWRKWLITKDEHADIKNAVLKELSHLAFCNTEFIRLFYTMMVSFL